MIVQTDHSEGEGSVLIFYFTEMKKPKFGTGIKIRISPLCRIDGEFMSRSAPAARNNEELASDLKTFIGVTVTAEEKTGLLKTDKGVGKVGF
jgi:hypothetical protein